MFTSLHSTHFTSQVHWWRSRPQPLARWNGVQGTPGSRCGRWDARNSGMRMLTTLCPASCVLHPSCLHPAAWRPSAHAMRHGMWSTSEVSSRAYCKDVYWFSRADPPIPRDSVRFVSCADGLQKTKLRGGVGWKHTPACRRSADVNPSIPDR